MRTFVALELSSPVRLALQARQQSMQLALQAQALRSRLRWVAFENFHLTLRFLGSTSVAQQQQLAGDLARIANAQPPFELALSELGCFPQWRRPALFWSGVAGALAELRQLQAAIEEVAQLHGFEAPSHAQFHPHITLARVRRGLSRPMLQELGTRLQALAEAPPWDAEQRMLPLSVQSIAHFDSNLQPAGPHYQTLSRWQLKG